MVGVDTRWLDDDELTAWIRLVGVVELLPGVLDTQLRRDAGLSHFEYYVLAMLSESPQRTLRMTALAARTNATLPRLSHVVRRLEDRGLVERSACPQDARATNATPHRGGLAHAAGHRSRPRRHRPAARDRRAHPGAGGSAQRDRRGDPGPARPRRPAPPADAAAPANDAAG